MLCRAFGGDALFHFSLQFVTVLILLVVASSLASCGGGSSHVENPGTPAGMSTVSVTASANGASTLKHGATLTITVTP